jgi:hypothetical protein
MAAEDELDVNKIFQQAHPTGASSEQREGNHENNTNSEL